MPEPARPATITFAPARAVETLARALTIDDDEHAGYVQRLRRGLLAGTVIWASFGVVDIVAVWIEEHARAALFAGLRLGLLAYLVGVVWLLGRRPSPSPRLVRVIDVLTYSLGSVAIALMCTDFGGVASPYFGGTVAMFVARGSFTEERWRESIVPNAMIAAGYAGVMLAAPLWNDRVAAQLADPAMRSIFVMNLCFLVVYAAFSGTAGHARWALRRQIYEHRNLGRYKLVRRIGAGGMGEVWVAHHSGLRRDVALKILRPSEHGPHAVQRFEREVQATAELVHPNTIRVFDYGVSDDGIWFYAMELLEGVDLARLVRDQGPLPPERAIDLVLQAADALAEAHAHGIVHRDVKPENLFVTSRDHLKVLDFGIARLVDDRADVSLTATGSVCGTPAYMAPEVLAGQRAGERSDVYSLGAVLYFVLVGVRPFEGQTLAEVLLAQQAAPPRPSDRGRTVPRALEDLVMCCLARDPEARYPNADALAIALRELRGRLEPVPAQ